MQPLEGITVVALEQAIAAPFCTRQLAELGARVIKVERPGSGDFARAYDQRTRGLSSHFVWVNRGKQSLTLDLKDPQARALLERLVLEQADVLVQNLAPGATARLGLDHATLAPKKPSLIVCDISGFGADGPMHERKAYDLIVQAEAGVMSVTGTPETMCKTGLPVADIAAGMHAYSSILAALLQRGRSGQGQRIDVSMLESLVEWMGFPLYYAIDGATPPARACAAHATIVPYGPFAVGDGGTVLLAVQNDREWAAFCVDVLRRPEIATDARFADGPGRLSHREALQTLITDVFAALDTAQVLGRLEAAAIANARVNDLAAVWAHPQLAARGRWASIASPVGPLPALRAPGFGGEPSDLPALGAHTDAILAALGIDAVAIAALRARRAV